MFTDHFADGFIQKFRRSVLLCAAFLLTGCGFGTISEQKTGDIAYEIVKKEEIPDKLKEEINEAKQSEMRISYADTGTEGNRLYIVRGYGKQERTGYSIEVNECYETANTVVVRTSLLGPQKKENTHKKKTYPYIVIKIPYSEKQIVYE